MLRIKKPQIDRTLFFGLKSSEYVATALSISMPVEPVYRTNLVNISSVQLIVPCFWMYSKVIPFIKIFRTIHDWQLYWGWFLSQAPGEFFVNTTVLNLIYLWSTCGGFLSLTGTATVANSFLAWLCAPTTLVCLRKRSAGHFDSICDPAHVCKPTNT